MESSLSASLLKEREKFTKRQAEAAAYSAPTEKRPKIEKSAAPKPNRPKSTIARSKTSSDLSTDYRSSGPSTTSFRTLTTIFEKLQERFLGGMTEPLTLDEIVAEFELTLDPSERHWLASKALLSNEQIDVKNIDDVNKFVYKPPLDLKGNKRQALLNLLKSRHEKCEGAVLAEHVRDSVGKGLGDRIIEALVKSGEVMRHMSNKKEILYYTDRAYNLQVNPVFIESWRKISVEGLDEKKIAEFLDTQGHRALAKNAPRPMAAPSKSKRGGRRQDVLKSNNHVASQLVDYSHIVEKK